MDKPKYKFIWKSGDIEIINKKQAEGKKVLHTILNALHTRENEQPNKIEVTEA